MAGEESETSFMDSSSPDATDSESATCGFFPSLAALIETDRLPGKVGTFPASKAVHSRLLDHYQGTGPVRSLIKSLINRL